MQKEIRQQVTEMLGLPINAKRQVIEKKALEFMRIGRAHSMGLPKHYTDAQMDAWVIRQEQEEERRFSL